VGLGGEGVLRTFGRDEEALAVIGEAAVQGIVYFDSARAYAGSEGYYGRFWPEHASVRAGVFQASKSARRDRSGALEDLKSTLAVMGLDYLDLWQIHDLRTWQDVREIEVPGGALEAFLEARDGGLARHIGVTGHHDPAVLNHAVQSWDLDSVLLPVNPVEGILGGFLTETLPLARERGMAVVGMKVLGAAHYINPRAGVTPELLTRYALSQEATVVTVGCSSPQEVRALVRTGREFQPLAEKEEARLLEIFRPYARKLAYYRGVI